MDSHNLATVFLPVLVRSADIQQDALICTMPRKISSLDKAGESDQRQKQGSASLGIVLKLCIDRYDDIFKALEGGEAGEKGNSWGVDSTAVTPASSRSTSTASNSSFEATSERSDHNGNQQHRPKTIRKNSSTLKLLGGSPGTVKKKLNGTVSRSEPSRESARGLFARE